MSDAWVRGNHELNFPESFSNNVSPKKWFWWLNDLPLAPLSHLSCVNWATICNSLLTRPLYLVLTLKNCRRPFWWPCLWNSEIYQEISPFRVLWKVFVSDGFTDFRVTHLKLEGTSLIQVTKGECWDLGTTSTGSCSNSHAVIVENITTLPSNWQWGEAILNGWKAWILEYKKKYSFMIFKH